MSYFAKNEPVYINSVLFPDDHEGYIVSLPTGGERYFDVMVTKTDDEGHQDRTLPLLEDELTKFE